MKRETQLWIERGDYDLATLNTRYVDVKQKLLETMNKEKAAECLKKTQEIVQCLKSALKI